MKQDHAAQQDKLQARVEAITHQMAELQGQVRMPRRSRNHSLHECAWQHDQLQQRAASLEDLHHQELSAVSQRVETLQGEAHASEVKALQLQGILDSERKKSQQLLQALEGQVMLYSICAHTLIHGCSEF